MLQTGPLLDDADALTPGHDWRDEAFLVGFAKGLPHQKNQGDLASYLAGELRGLFQHISTVELFVLQPFTGELTSAAHPREGAVTLRLLAELCEATGGTPPAHVADRPRLFASERSRPAIMSAPLVSVRGLLGLIVVQRRHAAADFTTTDLRALGAVADKVADVLPRVSSGAETGWSQSDLASAREIQRTLLPTLGTNLSGVRIAAEYRPAYAVGGDFYDLLDLQDGRLLGMIGDVSGKGVAAALMMSRVSSELHQLAAQKMSPADMLTRVNNSLQERTRDDRFVTVVCVVLDLTRRRWIVANAGHVVPILRRPDGSVHRLTYLSGPPLGMVPRHVYSQQEFPLGPRDILILVTDGVFETIDGQREPCSTMGTCRLTDLISSAPHDVGEIRRSILEAVGAASGRAADDVALLGMELTE